MACRAGTAPATSPMRTTIVTLGPEPDEVGRWKVEEHGAHRADRRSRDGKADRRTGCQQAQTLAHDHSQSRGRSRTESHPDADLSSTSSHRVGHDAVDPDADKDQADDTQAEGHECRARCGHWYIASASSRVCAVPTGTLGSTTVTARRRSPRIDPFRERATMWSTPA